jgi:hypothetical protein
MKWVLRLYPREWREKYGDEFSAVIENYPITLSVLFDVIICAIFSRFRIFLQPSRNDRPMKLIGVIRKAGLWFVVAGIAWLIPAPVLLGLPIAWPLANVLLAITAIAVLYLLAIGCSGLQTYSRTIGRWSKFGDVGIKLIRVSLFAASTTVVIVLGSLIHSTAWAGVLVLLLRFVGVLCIGTGFTLVGVTVTIRRIVPVWTTVPLLIIILGTVVIGALFIKFGGGATTPMWSIGVYWAMFLSLGIEFIVVGLSLRKPQFTGTWVKAMKSEATDRAVRRRDDSHASGLFDTSDTQYIRGSGDLPIPRFLRKALASHVSALPKTT